MFLTSVALIIILGLAINKVFSYLRIPYMLGLIILGITIGPSGKNLLAGDLLAISADLRMLALIIILLRAGLGINRETLSRIGAVALRMSAIPCLLEGGTITLAAHWLLKLPLVEAAMLGFVLAAVSPAVVVPEMLRLQEKRLGEDKAIPAIILGGAAVDDVFAITILVALLSLGTAVNTNIWQQLLRIPLEALGGVALGAFMGLVLSKVLRMKSLASSGLEAALLSVGAAIALTMAGERLRVAGLLAVMTLGFVVLERVPKLAQQLAQILKHAWLPASIFLFVLLGAEVNVQVGLKAGWVGLGVIGIGLIGRSAGVFLATAGAGLNLQERLFCAIAYLPKATVQAAVGGMPLAAGIASGELILAIAVLSIIITAPIGAISIRFFAPRLLNAGASHEPQPQFANN